MTIGRIWIFLLFLTPVMLWGQEEEERNWTVNGYVKDMATVIYQQNVDTAVVDNLIHNRINLHWFPSQKFSSKLEIRNRLFHGDFVRFVPEYGKLIDVNNDYLNLSYTWDNGDVVFHSMIDRAFVQWNEEKWELKLGRQRINWGVNVAWNPNDIFNAYSLFDFDYEERPGSDAIRFQRFIGYAGGYEFAVKMIDDIKDLTAAGMYKWNFKTYDMQALAGIMKNNIAMGGAWAGNIGLVGFKGEFTYFNTLDNDDKDSFLGSVSLDYSFPNSLYFNGSFLYNSYANGMTGSGIQSQANLDIRSISQFKWSTFLQTSYTFHPLINGGLMTLYYPGESGIFFNPFFTFSIVNNLDLDLIGQLFLDENAANSYLIYGRIKFSF